MNTSPEYVEYPMPQWATRIHRRNPFFKLHKGLGQAKNALSTAGHGALYIYYGNNRWRRVFVLDIDPQLSYRDRREETKRQLATIRKQDFDEILTG